MGDVGPVRLGQDAPAIIIVAGIDGQGWIVVILDCFDAAAQGVVGVVGLAIGLLRKPLPPVAATRLIFLSDPFNSIYIEPNLEASLLRHFGHR